jgi:hypothetical protein
MQACSKTAALRHPAKIGLAILEHVIANLYLIDTKVSPGSVSILVCPVEIKVG